MKRLLHHSVVAGLLIASACGTDSDKSTDSEPTMVDALTKAPCLPVN